MNKKPLTKKSKMRFPRVVLSLSIASIFLTAFFISFFQLVNLVEIILSEYVFSASGSDSNEVKRRVAESVAFLVFSIPVSVVFFVYIKKHLLGKII